MTYTGLVVNSLALAALVSTTAAAPSPIGEHIMRVSGSAIMGEASTSSTLRGVWNWACGLRLPLVWFLAATAA